MKRFIITAIILATATSVHAFGVGGYGTFGVGGTNFQSYGIPVLGLLSRHDLMAGGGALIDTNCASDRLFNYRLAIGASRTFRSDPGSGKVIRFNLVNTFGFGVVRREKYRFWLGPQLGISTYHEEYDPGAIRKMVRPIDYGVKYSLSGASAGFAMGLNLNFSHDITLALDGGYRYCFLYGLKHISSYMRYPGTNIPVPVSIQKWNWATSDDIHISVALMYRVDDSFASATLIEPENE